MKRLCTILVWLLGISLSAQTLRSPDGRTLTLPAQFVVQADGVRYVPTGAAEASVVAWGLVDLGALARDEPEIEAARHQTLLGKQAVFMTVAPEIDYIEALLELPIEVSFNPKWEVRIRADRYWSATGHFPDPRGTYDRCRAAGFILPQNLTVTVIDRTRYPLGTTFEGLLSIISQDGRSEVSRLVRDLRAHDAFFPNLAVGLRKLHELHPQDAYIDRARRAIEKLSNDIAISVDAQRELGNFLRYARERRRQQLAAARHFDVQR